MLWVQRLFGENAACSAHRHSIRSTFRDRINQDNFLHTLKASRLLQDGKQEVRLRYGDPERIEQPRFFSPRHVGLGSSPCRASIDR